MIFWTLIELENTSGFFSLNSLSAPTTTTTGVTSLDGAWQPTDLESMGTEGAKVVVGTLQWWDCDWRGGPNETAATLGLAVFIWNSSSLNIVFIKIPHSVLGTVLEAPVPYFNLYPWAWIGSLLVFLFT